MLKLSLWMRNDTYRRSSDLEGRSCLCSGTDPCTSKNGMYFILFDENTEKWCKDWIWNVLLIYIFGRREVNNLFSFNIWQSCNITTFEIALLTGMADSVIRYAEDPRGMEDTNVSTLPTSAQNILPQSITTGMILPFVPITEPPCQWILYSDIGNSR